jgi:hypothetical protein
MSRDRRISVTSLTAITMLLLLVALPSASRAHSCASLSRLTDKEYKTQMIDNATIFRGKVVSFESPEIGGQVIHVTISHRWQGAVEGTIPVLYYGAGQSFETEIGGICTEKVFFAQWNDKHQMLLVFYCGMASQSLVDIPRMERILGEGIPVGIPAKDAEPQTAEGIDNRFYTLVAVTAVICSIPIAAFILRSRR